MLSDAINEKLQLEKDLNKCLTNKLSSLTNSTTWLKVQLIKYSINRHIENLMNKIGKQHSKKLDTLIFEKKMKDGLHNNPNDLITNLTDRILLDVKVEILKCGLKHGIATRPSEPEMMVIAENIWDQIERNGLCVNMKKKGSVKTALRAFTYSYVDIFDTQFLHDKNKTKVLKQLRQDCVILKPDKGNGVVLINKSEYNLAMKKLFSDRSKFKVIQKDPTLTRLKTVQNYLNTMFK